MSTLREVSTNVRETDERTIHQTGVECHREGSTFEQNIGSSASRQESISGLKKWVELGKPQKTF